MQQQNKAGKEYRGIRRASGCQVDVRTTRDGRATTDWQPLAHAVRHSPTGFEWGYGGSGPADLARSLLFDYYGHAVPPGLYQRFKADVVQKMGDPGWVMDDTFIQGKVDAILAERGWTCPKCLNTGVVEAENGRRMSLVSCDCATGRSINSDMAEAEC